MASTMKYRLKGDGRTYGLFMKSDSYVEGTGVDEIWQAFVQTKCAPVRTSACMYLPAHVMHMPLHIPGMRRHPELWRSEWQALPALIALVCARPHPKPRVCAC